MSRAFQRRSPAIGQGWGSSRWPERGQSWPPGWHISGRAQATQLKGPVNQSHLFNIRPSLLAPGIQLAISPQPLYPQPEPDKGLFTWQSAVEDPGREKNEVPFSHQWGANPLPTRGFWSHGSNLKLKGEMGTLDPLARHHIKYLAQLWSQNKVNPPRP